MHRRGLSITEVLIAIFLMAIGMISLLALFPIGMLRMADSIRANRIGQAAANAQSLLELHALRDTLSNPHIEQAIRDTPGLFGDHDGNPNTPPIYLFINDPEATCPVLIDPIGCSLWPNPSALASSGDPVARTNTPLGPNLGIPRAYCNVTPPGSRPELRYRWFTLEDELTFLPSGQPVVNPVERQRRISWAYLWRRPVWGDPAVADVSVIVYSGRQLTGAPLPGGSATQEFRCGGPPAAPHNHRCFTVGSRVAWLNWGSPINPSGAPQAVRPGYWVLDATVMQISNNPPQWITNGFFYQVVNVLSEPDANGIQPVELDRPARANGYVAVFPLGIVDVIEKSDGRRPY
jgi:hypothetical protein